MRLSALLNEARVVVPLSVKTLSEAVRILIHACVSDGRVTDPEKLETVVRESWPEDTLTMGPSTFLPHFRTDAVAGLVVALGVAPAPIRRQPKAPRQGRVVLLVVAPPGEAAAYLQAIAAFARALAQPEVVAALHAARSAAEVLAIPALSEVTLEGQLLVRDLMTTVVHSVSPETLLGEAAALLMQHRIAALPVVGEGGQFLGLITHAELLRYLVPSYVHRVNTGQMAAARKVAGKVVTDPAQLPVREAMMRNVLCLPEDQTIADVATLMANKDLDHLPVVREGVLTGFLTQADVVRKVIGRA